MFLSRFVPWKVIQIGLDCGESMMLIIWGFCSEIRKVPSVEYEPFFCLGGLVCSGFLGVEDQDWPALTFQQPKHYLPEQTQK